MVPRRFRASQAPVIASAQTAEKRPQQLERLPVVRARAGTRQIERGARCLERPAGEEALKKRKNAQWINVDAEKKRRGRAEGFAKRAREQRGGKGEERKGERAPRTKQICVGWSPCLAGCVSFLFARALRG